MKKNRIAAIVALVLALIIVCGILVACENEPVSTKITYMSDGVVYITVTVTEQSSNPDVIPAKSGYTFVGWYTDEALTAPFDFDSYIANKDRANVLVYIGATGSFLDNITRGGFPKIISGFKRDFTSISATLKEIQSSNRHDETNTEVYLVGIPRYIGTPVTDILINRHLKEIAKNYANVTYVEPIKAKLFYGLKADVHLNDEENLSLNNSIIESIDDNYIAVMAKIEIDRFLFKLNEIIEISTIEIVGQTDAHKIAIMHEVVQKNLVSI